MRILKSVLIVVSAGVMSVLLAISAKAGLAAAGVELGNWNDLVLWVSWPIIGWSYIALFYRGALRREYRTNSIISPYRFWSQWADLLRSSNFYFPRLASQVRGRKNLHFWHFSLQ